MSSPREINLNGSGGTRHAPNRSASGSSPIRGGSSGPPQSPHGHASSGHSRLQDSNAMFHVEGGSRSSDHSRRASDSALSPPGGSASFGHDRRGSDDTMYSSSPRRAFGSLDGIRDVFSDDVTLASDSNSTTTDLPGPGRVLGSLFSKGGKIVSHIVDRGAEKLGHGPDAHCIKLLTAIEDEHRVSKHNIRVPKNRLSLADLNRRDCNFILHWATSRCEYCNAPFITLTDAYIRSQDAHKAANELVNCLAHRATSTRLLALRRIISLSISSVAFRRLFISLPARPMDMLDVTHRDDFLNYAQSHIPDLEALMAQSQLCALILPWPDPLEFDHYLRHMCLVSSGAQQWLNTREYIQDRDSDTPVEQVDVVCAAMWLYHLIQTREHRSSDPSTSSDWMSIWSVRILCRWWYQTAPDQTATTEQLRHWVLSIFRLLIAHRFMYGLQDPRRGARGWRVIELTLISWLYNPDVDPDHEPEDTDAFELAMWLSRRNDAALRSEPLDTVEDIDELRAVQIIRAHALAGLESVDKYSTISDKDNPMQAVINMILPLVYVSAPGSPPDISTRPWESRFSLTFVPRKVKGSDTATSIMPYQMLCRLFEVLAVSGRFLPQPIDNTRMPNLRPGTSTPYFVTRLPDPQMHFFAIVFTRATLTLTLVNSTPALFAGLEKCIQQLFPWKIAEASETKDGVCLIKCRGSVRGMKNTETTLTAFWLQYVQPLGYRLLASVPPGPYSMFGRQKEVDEFWIFRAITTSPRGGSAPVSPTQPNFRR